MSVQRTCARCGQSLAESMTGANDRFVMALPHDRLIELLRQYNRLLPKAQ